MMKERKNRTKEGRKKARKERRKEGKEGGREMMGGIEERKISLAFREILVSQEVGPVGLGR